MTILLANLWLGCRNLMEAHESGGAGLRERLLSPGPHALTDAELLAILLRVAALVEAVAEAKSRMALNRQHLLLVTLLCLSLSGISASPSLQPATAAQDIYTDALAPGWSNYSWATVDLQAAAPVHSGSRSIAVTYGAWQGLYLHYPELSTAGFSHLRFFIHGGSAGGQRLNVYATHTVNGSDQNGPSVAVSPPTANAWSEVRIALADLGVANAALTGLVWQDSTGGVQPTLYIDDIALVTDESPDGPTLSAGYLLPRAAPADGVTEVVVRVQVSDPQGLADIASVTLDASALGRGEIALRDDGWSNDGAPSDGVYGGVFTVAPRHVERRADTARHRAR